MKIKILSLLILLGFLTSFVFAEVTTVVVGNPDKTVTRIFYKKGKEIAQQKQDRDGNVMEMKGKIPDGVVKEFLGDGKMGAEWHYKKGKLEGMAKEYYQSGELLEEILFKDGKREGISKKYYKSGKLLAERNFKNGKLEGFTKMYYENGKVVAELSYKEGLLDGECKMYYEDGKLRVVELYANQQKIKLKSYDPQGKLLFEKDYTSDENTDSTSITQPHKGDTSKEPGK